ncbi:ATP-binding protein [Lignipirellula cremea]|uniref:ATP-binding protein n=1 Tax=Lignipirellula cremea TaxID=2528010 RepID=UPI0018D21F5C|nr:ATP-binding protein [Lignipirellula cremea]
MLIFLVLAFASWQLFTRAALEQANSAHRINVSGRQRMLTARMGLLAARWSSDPAARSSLRDKLQAMVGLYASSHQALLNGDSQLQIRSPVAPSLRRLYLGQEIDPAAGIDTPVNLDAQVRRYTSDVRSLLERSDKDVSAVERAVGQVLAGAMDSSLPDDLDRMVAAEENHSRQQVASLQIQAWTAAVFAMGLSLLLLERGWSFHWQAAAAAETQTRLEQLNAELEDRVAERTLELREANTALCREVEDRQMAQAMFQDLYEHAPDMYVSVNAETGLVEQANATVEHVLGIPRSQIIGRPMRELYHENSREEAEKVFALFQATGEIKNAELQLRRHDHSPLVVSLSVSAVRDARGAIVRSRSVWRDITEFAQTRSELRRLNAQLEQRVADRVAELKTQAVELATRNHDLDEFAYVASHDLKAPLRGIHSLSLWIEEDSGAALSAESKQNLKKLRDRAVRLERLLDDLLVYSRVGRTGAQVEEIDAAQLITQVWEHLRAPKTFTLQIAGGLPQFKADRRSLEQVLRHLLQNAVKHHHGETGQIEATCVDRGDFLEFSVIDDGPGIEERFHQRIFRMFETLKPRNEVEGSGMGLALARKIVTSVGGQILVESIPGQGARFSFTWPKQSE